MFSSSITALGVYFVRIFGVKHLKLSDYARIGRAPLVKSVGLQGNHKIYEETNVLDRSRSGCFVCPNYKYIEFEEYMPEEIRIKAHCQCDTCPHREYKTVVKEKYVNEKNVFGYSPRLKAIAIKVLVLYHFLEPNEQGIIHDVSYSEIAKMLNCTSKSIHNANNTLQEYGYIYCTPIGKHAHQVLLREYTTYHQPANQGGRGYITMNQEFFSEIIKIKDLNQLRLSLRIALDVDTNLDPETTPTVKHTYASLRRYLPQYCKPGIIRGALNSLANLLQLTEKEDSSVRITLLDKFHGRRNRDISFDENLKKLKGFFSPIIEEAKEKTKLEIAGQKQSPMINSFVKTHLSPTGKTLYMPIELSDNDYKDLANLCITYPFELVIKATDYIFQKYTNTSNCLGASIRSAILSEKVVLS